MTEVCQVDTAACIEDIHRLWLHCLGPGWAVEPRLLRTRLEGTTSGCQSVSLGIYAEDHLIGFVTVQHCSGSSEAGLVVLLVDRGYQRRGLGTRLCHEAVAALRAHGVKSIRLGAGGASYFWPGVPHACIGAVDFFQAQGWTVEEQSYDLVQDISAYASRVPPPENVEISTLRPDDADAVVEFATLHFPDWASAYAQTVRAGDLADVITACCDGMIVGITHIQAVAQRDGHPWQPVLGTDMGVLGAVGVDERYWRRGIGLAMVDFATCQLRQRGVRNCLVGWTWLTQWYGRLGYRIWHTYDMFVRKI